MKLELPESSRFKIPELVERWNKTEDQILELAADGHLELWAQIFGCFLALPTRLLNSKEHNNEKGDIIYSVDFKLYEQETIRAIANKGNCVRPFITASIDGEESGVIPYPVELPNDDPNRSREFILITLQDLYVPLTSVEKFDKPNVPAPQVFMSKVLRIAVECSEFLYPNGYDVGSTHDRKKYNYEKGRIDKILDEKLGENVKGDMKEWLCKTINPEPWNDKK